MKISALISDYDGTLCPTASFSFSNSLPEDFHNILLDISKFIPVCIVSSKDFHFLDSCVNFAVIMLIKYEVLTPLIYLKSIEN